MVAPHSPPLRERLLVQSAAAAGTLAPDLVGFEVERLWRPRGAAAFRWAQDGAWLGARDELVVYRWRSGNAEDIAAINAMFSAAYYPGALGLWPDERALLAEAIPPRGALVLEICCGAGRLTEPLRRAGNRVVGVDVVAGCLARAARGEGLAYVRGDALALPFAPGAFDHCVCLENSLGVFSGREARVVAELARVCRPGGRVILGLRAEPGAAGSLVRYRSPEGYLELARVFSPLVTVRFLRGIGPACGLRGVRRLRASGPRPWGGEVGYWVLERI
ncbi:MAG: class I SAM-dependent methyltransferase [Pseudomonadota bacterium]